MPRRITCLLLALVVGCTSPPARYDDGLDRWQELDAEQTPRDERPVLDETGGLPAHVRYAERNNPGLQASMQRWRAALARVPEATSLPDPRLTLGIFVDEVETRVGPMDWRVGLSQSFPWIGTLDLAGQAALERAEAAREEFEARRLKVAASVRDTWHEYAYVQAAVDVTRAHLDLLLSWEEVARTRYATGLGTESDVIRAQVELGKLDDRVRTLEDLRRPVAARFNATLDRAPDAKVPVGSMTVTSGLHVDGEALQARLVETSPALRALRRSIEAATHQVDLADKQFYPDFSIGLDYTAIGSARASGVQGSGDDALAITAGISLPLRRDRYRAGAARAKAELAAAHAALREAHNRLAADLELALYSLRDAERRLGLYRDTLVPKGRQSVESTTVAYQAGDAGFLDLIDAQRLLLEFQLAAARAHADHGQALAEVERITGVSLHTEDGP
ncbi:MAG: TolC family protein [Planctomycetota bacterium]|jgi:outer membrane protein TolC